MFQLVSVNVVHFIQANVGNRWARLPLQLKVPFRKIQQDRIILAFGPIILAQLLAKTPDLKPHDRILAGIISRRLAKGIDSNRVFLELIRLS